MYYVCTCNRYTCTSVCTCIEFRCTCTFNKARYMYNYINARE